MSVFSDLLPTTQRVRGCGLVLLLAAGVALGAATQAMRQADAAPAASAAMVQACADGPPAADRARGATDAPRAFDALRIAAALGNADAGVAMVQGLLDRYEAGAGPAALFEAMLQLEHGWDTAPMLASGQIQRVVLGACRQDALLRWHWLCNEGE